MGDGGGRLDIRGSADDMSLEPTVITKDILDSCVIL
jgi:hypothetical protein